MGENFGVGYLSADLANHPVGRFLLPVLSHHNKKSGGMGTKLWIA